MFYVTTPIYYVNDEPHIGHAYTTVTADALARWHRLAGEETFFLTGTDEHGLKMQRAAEANGLTPSEQADRFAARYLETWRLLNISNDDFIRTTEPRHHRAVSKLLQACYDRGDIELGTYEGLYSVADEAYVTAGEVSELERQGRPVISLKEENYFFKLSRYTRALLDWYEAHPGFVQPESRRNEAVGFIRQGLKDFSISRTSIDWGIPLPWDHRHVTYVWFDALTNYLTAVGYGEDDPGFPARWAGARHLIGKDILRFHCVYWPAMLLSAGLEPPHSVYVHGYLLVGGEKMSKTRLNQIAPATLVETVGVDGFRYHFLADQRFGPDGEFSYEGMVARYNSDLANNLGNLAARVAAVVAAKCGGVGPAPSPGGPLAEAAAAAYEETARAWERVSPSEALEATWRLIREANSHLEAHEPWKMEPGPAVEAVLGDALEALRIVAVLASPAVPGATAEIWRRLGLTGSPEEQRLPAAAAWGGYPGGLPVSKGPSLFPRLTA
ncbi:MAG TPA: methionine--tRNA ligase [Acidimicrobiia bacterium]|nr:methionine--tRNA ligase [Acidimicrobiia bacterium]